MNSHLYSRLQRSAQLAEAWRLLAHIAKERDVVDGEFQREALHEGEYSRAYQAPDQESVDAKNLRSTIVSGGLTHLEEQ